MSGLPTPGWMADHPRLMWWLNSGERGLSSDTIVAALTGAAWPHFGLRHPLDPADFHRCELLLRQVPTLRPLFPSMASVSPEWARLVDRWDEIVALMESEVPGCFGDRPPNGPAYKAYGVLKECRFEAAAL